MNAFTRLWARLTKRHVEDGSTYSPDERRFQSEGVEGYQADEFVTGHLGGTEPDWLDVDDRRRAT
jgi:hypothetical protein